MLEDRSSKKENPLIACSRCGHSIQYHSDSFGTGCEFYRCQCIGWRINSNRSDVEFLPLDGSED